MTGERDPLASAYEHLSEMQGEMSRWLGSIMEDILNPSILQDFIEIMGSGMPQQPNMSNQHTGFDAYWLLGLEKSASDEEVRKRYRALLHRLHPDTAGVEGTERLLSLVIAAYGQIAKERNNGNEKNRNQSARSSKVATPKNVFFPDSVHRAGFSNGTGAWGSGKDERGHRHIGR